MYAFNKYSKIFIIYFVDIFPFLNLKHWVNKYPFVKFYLSRRNSFLFKTIFLITRVLFLIFFKNTIIVIHKFFIWLAIHNYIRLLLYVIRG